jgi:GNAT superfamily N-acetyltransferase
MSAAKSRFAFHPATAERWQDLTELFGARGACGGCWCMTWRRPRSEFNANKGEGNRRALHALVKREIAPGVLAYAEGKAVAWCAIAPRTEYPALERSRVLRPVDDQPVWSISCLFVRKACRRQGLSSQLIAAAVEFAKTNGAKVVEGYPQVVEGSLPDAFVWTGLESSFLKAGFVEVARRSPKRPILRSGNFTAVSRLV